MAEATQKGLEGVVVADTRTSSVNGVEGKLIYGGFKIEDLAENALFEEVAFLLWNARLPKASELEALRKSIAEQAALPEAVIAQMRQYPKDADGMAVLRTVTSLLALYDPDAEDMSLEAAQRKAVRLTGQMTAACAAWTRIIQGQDPIPPRTDYNLAQNFLYMMTGDEPEQAAVDAVNVYLVLLADHGMNASTFTSRVVTATLADMHSAVVAAIGALKGPAHGGANAEAMKMFLEIGDPDNVEAWFKKEVKEGSRRIMGIGHRVYKAPDPRAGVLKRKAEALAAEAGIMKWFEIARRLEEAARADDYFIERDLYPNVDYYSAIVLYTLKLEINMFTPLFAMSRVAGWTAHIIEQMQKNRLIRPRGNYVGPVDQTWTPIAER
jgi:citrate synthase